MSLDAQFNKIIVSTGYKNVADFSLKYVLPLMSIVLFLFFITLFIFDNLPAFIPYMILMMGVLFICVYPYIQYENKKSSINENLHLFITYAGTIATIDINRHLLFKKIASRKTLGEVAAVCEKIEYFARKWNLGFAKTCREIGRLTPSKIFADFLDRLAVMLDFGESLTTFLNDEQISVMDDYATNYKKSLERIKTLQEIFISLTMALGFMMSIGLILPLISSTPMETIVRYSLLALFILDMFVLIFVHSMIPSDKLCQTSDIVDDDKKNIYKWVFITFPISFVMLIILMLLDFLPFLVNIGIAILPLFGLGIYAQKVEESIFTKDKAFPAFIRSLGSAVEIKSGAIISALKSLQVHDFGPINQLAIHLHRRLKTGNNKYQCWRYFCADSGSNLIYQFTQIFSEAVFMGGAPEKIGEIVSVNFQKLLALRKLKIQLASELRGTLYGALVGFSAAAYISAEIAKMLGGLFSTPFQSIQGSGMGMSNIIGDMAPTALNVNMEMIALYVGIMIIVHSVVSGIILKLIDGGIIYAALFDIVLMILLGAVISWVLPWGVHALLPGMGDLVSTSAAAVT
ncbi:MAG: hypothetical protein ACOCWQ_02245 [Nanoarchaeota archaeon]